MSYMNNIFWTPRFYLQKDISQEFLWELRKFRKIDIWTLNDQVSLTQLILTEATRDTSFEIAFNYKCEPSNFCMFHGSIDLLIYNNIKEDKY